MEYLFYIYMLFALCSLQLFCFVHCCISSAQHPAWHIKYIQYLWNIYKCEQGDWR